MSVVKPEGKTLGDGSTLDRYKTENSHAITRHGIGVDTAMSEESESVRQLLN